MNINIANGELNGFLNLSSVSELELIPTNSGELIAAPFTFNAWPQNTIGNNLKLLYDRLKYGGTLKLGGYDCIEFAKQTLRGQIPAPTRNQMIQDFQNFMSLDEITDLVKEVGFKIVSRHLDNVHFLIEATK